MLRHGPADANADAIESMRQFMMAAPRVKDLNLIDFVDDGRA